MTGIRGLHKLAGWMLPGTPIWEYEWDICCILDGCRVETFRAFRPCESYRSVASSSRPWIKRTFADPPDGVAYVTGNPFLDAADTDELAYVHQIGVGHVRGVETVSPAALTDHAAALWDRRDEYGVERIVVHYMQPHVPFWSRPAWFDPFSRTVTWGSCRWEALADGEISRDAWFHAYRCNLAWVLNCGVDRLADRVDATIGVTADHGNAAGEWGVYGHPEGVAVPAVRRVPWARVEGGKEQPVPSVELGGQGPQPDRDAALRALGYR